jgi:hypothetical protein
MRSAPVKDAERNCDAVYLISVSVRLSAPHPRFATPAEADPAPCPCAWPPTHAVDSHGDGVTGTLGLREGHADQHGYGYSYRRRRAAGPRRRHKPVTPYQQSWLCAAKVEDLEALVKLIKVPSKPEYGIDAHEHPEAYLADTGVHRLAVRS